FTSGVRRQRPNTSMCGTSSAAFKQGVGNLRILFKPLPYPAIVAFFGMVFCYLSTQKSIEAMCNTAGCTLYHETSIGGISLWWFGLAAFATSCLLALLGQSKLGLLFSKIVLFLDCGLLLLMDVTAPCLNCMGVAVLFALCYFCFLKTQPHTISWLLRTWIILLAINVGGVLKSAIGHWPILGDESARVHIYFSPSCSHCRDAINFYSGNIDVAFYPVQENSMDLEKIAAMQQALNQGLNLQEAVEAAQKCQPFDIATHLSFDKLLLSFRILCNKAHVFMSGSSGVPFFEYRGLPSYLTKEIKRKKKQDLENYDVINTLGINGESGQCTERSNCN
ncbi:MAG: hypothetical protein IK079_02145, partial [Desulfovibrio sp.]|nr:hypothetical protein [Desulfovibrio sp.]